jgi:hypothetical protein
LSPQSSIHQTTGGSPTPHISCLSLSSDTTSSLNLVTYTTFSSISYNHITSCTCSCYSPVSALPASTFRPHLRCIS